MGSFSRSKICLNLPEKPLGSEVPPDKMILMGLAILGNLLALANSCFIFSITYSIKWL